jgi:hypothetical protein
VDTVESVRTMTAGDAGAVQEFLAGLPAEGRPLCFFEQTSPERIASYWRTPDHGRDHCGLLAESSTGAIVAHAAYIRLYGPRAEVALDLDGDLDRPAVAAELMGRLAELARANGIRRFVTTGPVGHRELAALVFGGRPAFDDATRAVIEFETVAIEPALASGSPAPAPVRASAAARDRG